jgi:hypothetical protein
MTQIPYWGPIILEWPVNLAVTWHLVFCACELIHIFECKGEKTAIIMLEIFDATTQNLVAQDLCTPCLPYQQLYSGDETGLCF